MREMLDSVLKLCIPIVIGLIGYLVKKVRDYLDEKVETDKQKDEDLEIKEIVENSVLYIEQTLVKKMKKEKSILSEEDYVKIKGYTICMIDSLLEKRGIEVDKTLLNILVEVNVLAIK